MQVSGKALNATIKKLCYLHACLWEWLRVFPSNNTGLPRYSPGVVVVGHYIPKGLYLSDKFICSAFPTLITTHNSLNLYLRHGKKPTVLPRCSSLHTSTMAAG